MVQMSKLSILLVSFPEEIIMAIIGILCIGRYNYLKSKVNLAKLIFLSVVMSVSSHLIRGNVSNEIESALVHLFILSLLYIFIARLKFYESIMAALLSLIIIAIIQTPALLSVSALSGITYKEALENDLKLFLFVLPERAIEFSLIFLAVRHNLKIIDLESATIKKKEYYIQLFVYIVSIFTLLFLSIVMAKILISDHGNFMNSTNALLLRLNVYLTLFVTIVLTLAIRSTSEYYRNKSTLTNKELLQSLEYISNLVDDKDYEELKNAVSSLKTHISKQ